VDAGCDILDIGGESTRPGSEGVDVDEAILAGHLRRAADALAEVTGAEIGTDLVDRIFSRHCIGK